MPERFEELLAGGHPNSLGKTVEVVEIVLASPDRFDELFSCYGSSDEVVRLRTSNAMKRIEAERHDLLVPYIDRFIAEIGELDQDSARWTLAQLFLKLEDDLSADQRRKAVTIMKRNLEDRDDWIVLNATMETLTRWASNNTKLASWLRPHLERLAKDKRKSIASRASKKLKALG